MDFKQGTRVNRYLLIKRLGKGGQGSVWEAFPVEGSNAPRALKLIDLGGVEPAKAERAWREAQTLHDVKHPGLVPCREFFRDTDTAVLGLAFDLVQGQTLSAAAKDSRMNSEFKAAILEQLATILAHVHTQKIVHRDLKPDNVLITDAFWTSPHALGGVKLVDFGISVQAGNPSPVTKHGYIVGTAPYLPPTQNALDRDGPARDVFAFGVMGWELLIGAHPTGLIYTDNLDSKEYANVYREAQNNQRVWPPPAMDSPWMQVLRACLTLDPQCRPANGEAILELLRTVRHGTAETSSARAAITAEHIPPTGNHAIPTVAQTPLRMTATMQNPPATSPPVYPTAPVQWQGTSAPHIPVRPKVIAKSPNTSLLVVGFIVAAALGAFALWAIAFPKGASSPENPARPSEAPNSLPVPPQSIAQAQVPEIIPCCINQGICPSGHTCDRDRCEDKALAEREWTLRITGAMVTARNEDLSVTHPKATVCMRNDRSGDKICAPMSSITRAGGDRVNVLHATTSDLISGRITIWVTEGGKPLYPDEHMADNREGIKTSALCRGMRLRAGPRDSAPVHVFVFLD